jgi:sec-independent protein translocase protein TatA
MTPVAFYNNPTALIVLAVVVIVLFGGSKIPEMMKGLGQGMREFKKGMNEPHEDDELRKEREKREEVEREVRARVEEEMRKKG